MDLTMQHVATLAVQVVIWWSNIFINPGSASSDLTSMISTWKSSRSTLCNEMLKSVNTYLSSPCNMKDLGLVISYLYYLGEKNQNEVFFVFVCFCFFKFKFLLIMQPKILLIWILDPNALTFYLIPLPGIHGLRGPLVYFIFSHFCLVFKQRVISLCDFICATFEMLYIVLS